MSDLPEAKNKPDRRQIVGGAFATLAVGLGSTSNETMPYRELGKTGQKVSCPLEDEVGC